MIGRASLAHPDREPERSARRSVAHLYGARTAYHRLLPHSSVQHRRPVIGFTSAYFRGRNRSPRPRLRHHAVLPDLILALVSCGARQGLCARVDVNLIAAIAVPIVRASHRIVR